MPQYDTWTPIGATFDEGTWTVLFTKYSNGSWDWAKETYDDGLISEFDNLS